MTEIDCLKHCDAACCRAAKYFIFSPEEAERLIAVGTVLTPDGEVKFSGRRDYIKEGPCAFLREGRCLTHKTVPEVCAALKPGSKACLKFRAENPTSVKNLIKEDEVFQAQYFGLDDE